MGVPLYRWKVYFIENPNRTWIIWGFHRGDIMGYLWKNPKKSDAWCPRVGWFGGTTMTCRKLPDVQNWPKIWLHHVAIFCIIVSFGMPKNMAGSDMSDLWWFCAKARGWGCGKNHETIQFWLLLNIGYRSLEYIGIGIIILGKHMNMNFHSFTRVFVLTPVHMHHCNTSSSYIWHGLALQVGPSTDIPPVGEAISPEGQICIHSIKAVKTSPSFRFKICSDMVRLPPLNHH